VTLPESAATPQGEPIFATQPMDGAASPNSLPPHFVAFYLDRTAPASRM
jgi:hypothetical protein